MGRRGLEALQSCLFSIYDVHDNTAFQHACQSCLLREGVIVGGGATVCLGGD